MWLATFAVLAQNARSYQAIGVGSAFELIQAATDALKNNDIEEIGIIGHSNGKVISFSGKFLFPRKNLRFTGRSLDIDILKKSKRSGLLTVNSYSRSHWNEILNLDRAISSSSDIEEKLELQRQIRMYSINVPVIKSVNFAHRFGDDDREYVIVESDYDTSLGLLIDL